MRDILLINVAGPDRPGLTVALTETLARHDVRLLDMGQAVIHADLAWGMLVEVPRSANDGPLYKDLLFAAHELGLTLRIRPVSDDDYRNWVARGERARHIITLLGREIHARHIAGVTSVVAAEGLNIDRIQRLSGRPDPDTPTAVRRSAVGLAVSGDVEDIASVRQRLLRLSQALGVDIAIQADDVFRRNRRLVCFDMDSTLIAAEMIDELAAAAGVGEAVQAVTEAAMAGELDFKQSFARRLALLKGLPEAALPEIAARMPLTEGAERLIHTLHSLGFTVAILSGGFRYFAEHLRARLKIDYVYANELKVRDGKLTGEVVPPVVDGERKAELLRQIAERERISLAQTIAVGDGANDLPMLSIAGLGVAFNAKPVVREHAELGISNLGLDGLLYLLGMRDRELAMASMSGRSSGQA
ncbi:MAG: phosphoserine phosphatase SerB [Pseudomonadota bacterium]